MYRLLKFHIEIVGVDFSPRTNVRHVSLSGSSSREAKTQIWCRCGPYNLEKDYAWTFHQLVMGGTDVVPAKSPHQKGS